MFYPIPWFSARRIVFLGTPPCKFGVVSVSYFIRCFCLSLHRVQYFDTWPCNFFSLFAFHVWFLALVSPVNIKFRAALPCQFDLCPFCHLLMFNLLHRLCTFVVLRALAITQAALTYTKISYTLFMTSHKRSVWFCVPIYLFFFFGKKKLCAIHLRLSKQGTEH